MDYGHYIKPLDGHARGIIGAAFSNKLHLNNTSSNTPLMIVAIFCAFIFDWVVSLSVLHILGPDLLFVYILSGIPFDILHAVGNMCFLWHGLLHH